MEFKKFNSIKNIEQEKFVNNVIDLCLDKYDWVRTLKIHGSNYSLWCDGISVERAKRSGFLKDESFYGDYTFVHEHVERMFVLFEYLKSKNDDIQSITVYGEIYGGIYPHPDVPKVSNAVRVQKEVYYRPDNGFIVFDIMINNFLVDFYKRIELCDMVGFDHVPILEVGKFQDLITRDVVFEDPLYKTLGLPSIENNISEGWVLEPVVPQFLPSGDRVIMKGKNPKFKERSKKERKQVKSIELDDESKDLLDELMTFVTKNRLNNVISHIGSETVTSKDFGKILGMFIQDILNDFFDVYNHRFEVIDKGYQKVIKKMAQAEAANLLREEFVKIVG